MRIAHIMPVIDLLGGAVVRGVAGRRETYRPLVSRIAADSSPAAIAKAFYEQGFRECYVADLDGILTGQPDWTAHQQIVAAGLTMWLDAGVVEVASCERLLGIEPVRVTNEVAGTVGAGVGAAKIIVGLESLASQAELSAMLRMGSPDRLVVSLDMHAGRMKTHVAAWADVSPLDVADQILAMGVRRLIVLDLASVGMHDGGSTHALCRAIRDRHSELELISGGGIRSVADIEAFLTAGCDRVLVASGLHQGELMSAIRVGVSGETP